ncbi:MAG: hypothetical protein K2G23_02320 [Muribaculaceae bacterium]|nr:hypothetical protein [Muribaculaceae bacterium]
MKKLLLLSLMAVAASATQASVENRTVVEGRTWNYLITGVHGKTTADNHRYMSKGFHFKGTAIIEGTEYSIFRDEADKEIAYMREEDHKVYLYCGDRLTLDYKVEAEGKTEVMLYDFSAVEGDTFPCVGFDDTASHFGIEYEAKVEGTGTIDYEGNKFGYQDIYVTDPTCNEDRPYRFIEGLGCTDGLLPFPQFANWTSGMTQESEALFSVTDADGKLIYKNTALAASLTGYIPTDLDWQYYVSYGSMMVSNWEAISSFTIKNSDNPTYPYAWVNKNYKKWQQNTKTGEYEYVGETEVNETAAYLREEDGKVYLSLDPYQVPQGQPYPWFMFGYGAELSTYTYGDYEPMPYTPQPGEEVILYDFTVKVGDRYRTITTGSIICDVTVIKVTESDETIPGEGKVIEALPDYTKFWFEHWREGEDIPSEFIIKYSSTIGNLHYGNYVCLMAQPLDRLSDGSDADYVINNIYNKKGDLVYKGKDFQGYSAVKNIYLKPTEGKLYDLYGREVSVTVPGSIYIRDGKKFVAK